MLSVECCAHKQIDSDSKYTVQTNRDGAMREVDVISESGKAYQTGDRTVITRYQDGTLYIQ